MLIHACGDEVGSKPHALSQRRSHPSATAPTPDQVRGRLFSGSCCRASAKGIECEGVPWAPIGAVVSAHPHGLRPAVVTAANPDIVEVGGCHDDSRARRMMRVAGGPEVSAVGRGPAIPELVLRGRVAVGVRVRNPAVDPRPLIFLQAVIADRCDRRRVGDRVEGERVPGPQSVPSKARTCMVSEPPAVPPRIHTLSRSAAATVMAVSAG